MASLFPRVFLALTLVGAFLTLSPPGLVAAQQATVAQPALIHRVQAASERQELTVRQSRILTLEKRIPKFQVINPEILGAHAVSPNQIQIVALATGVTQINLWDEDDNVFTIDVVIMGDIAELTNALTRIFPDASLEILPIHEGVVISGIVSQERDIPTILQIAAGYYTNVVDNMEVGGMHQVLLHVKIIEISRTKLRAMGFDWTQISGANRVSLTSVTVDPISGGGFSFNVFDGADQFIGLLELMCQNSYAKTLAEPTLVALSGRAASFRVGGEVGFVEAIDNNGTAQIGWKQYGTEIEFVPIVLGNGKIQLEIRPRVSSLDRPNYVGSIPAIKSSSVDTSVELMPGQTLAIAGLIESRVEADRRGIPWISELPYLGTWFRRVEYRHNEVELLILVTPELASGMNADQVPKCLPGSRTTGPNDWELYLQGHIEVPKCCADGSCEKCRKESEGFRNTSVQVGGPGLIGAFDGQGRMLPLMDGESFASGASDRRTALPSGLETPLSSPPWTPFVVPSSDRAPPEPTGLIPQPGLPSAVSRENPPLPSATVPPSPPQDVPSPPGASTTGELPGFLGPVGYDVAQ